MKFKIIHRNIREHGDLTDYIEHRLSFAFARMRHEVDSATLTLSDINGPKGGIDKQCQMVIRASGLRPLVITEKRDHLRQAIDRCLHRASQSLSRKLKRKQLRLRKTPRRALASPA
ncbi:MAG: HPF/RaiA family ribosome-associated protein [Cellvibrionales bacterium]|nr:HPF/RaiA family ribosome-associated protein [Cellvibrionales bacterium]